MDNNTWDCIVIGAGIIGSWTGYHLANNGQKTLILEQFMLPHSRGSSCGQSRIMRMAYTQDCYAEMMPESYNWWAKLAEDTGTTVFKETGILLIQSSDATGAVDLTAECMDRAKLPYTNLNSSELAKNYPQLQFGSGYKGLLDGQAGSLLSSRCLQAVQDEFKKNGGKIRDNARVLDLVQGDVVQVLTSTGRYTTKKVVVCAGPWTTDLLTKTGVNLPIKTMPGLNVYYQSVDKTDDRYNADKGMPITYQYLSYHPTKYRFVCLFPSLEYPGMVKLVTRGEPPAYYGHPDDRDAKSKDDMVQILTKYLKDHFPGIDPTPKILEPCVYSMTPDRDYIIDYHPRCQNIIIGAGFSGHGYMRAPVIGEMLMQLVQGTRPSYNLDAVKLSRFKMNAKL